MTGITHLDPIQAQSLASALPTTLFEPAAKLFRSIGWSDGLHVFPIRPEASRRRYFRARPPEKPSRSDIILCHDPDLPEHGAQADFIVIAAYLRKQGIPVPEVLSSDIGAGLLLVSDAGDRDLRQSLTDDANPEILNAAIDLLVRLHAVEPPVPVRDRAFDREKLLFEIRFLEDALHDLEQTRRQPPFLSPELRFFLRGLCGLLGEARPHVFTHRDYHSRNLLVSEDGRLTMVDFQDARMGLPWYDLASLLFDPYAEHSRVAVEDGFRRYCSGAGIGPAAHRNVFFAQALQRLFKALGTYIHLTFRGELSHIYGRSIAPALDRLELASHLGGFPDSVYLFVGDARRRLLPLIPGTHP